MLVYEKKVDGARKLFGTMGNTPAESDVQLTYKDGTGTVITPVSGDSYIDGGSAEKIQRITRKSDSKAVNVFIGDQCIIGKVETTAKVAEPVKAVEPVKVAAEPVKARAEEVKPAKQHKEKEVKEEVVSEEAVVAKEEEKSEH